MIFLMGVCAMKYSGIYLLNFIAYLKFKFNWMSCILSDNPAYLGS